MALKEIELVELIMNYLPAGGWAVILVVVLLLARFKARIDISNKK